MKTMLLATAALVAAIAPLGGARAVTYSVLYSFNYGDGASPYAGLQRDSAGNLYGTTEGGGDGSAGTVFKLAPDGSSETVLHSFQDDGIDGTDPEGSVQLDGRGNIYGTARTGGPNDDGVIFKLDSSGNETILHDFADGNDGSSPVAGLNKFFGTTPNGGTNEAGTVFKISRKGVQTVVHLFTGSDGRYPYGGLISDSTGNLYGTTYAGGTYENGTVFQIAPDGTETVLYSFTGGSDGGTPYCALKRDSSGNLYGTTSAGGNGYGTVFKVTSGGSETVLYSFTGGSDGAYPYAGLVANSAGTRLYGTAFLGGVNNYGTVFGLDHGTFQVLHTFTGIQGDGANPFAALITDGAGNLYSTTSGGGANGLGTVFKVSEK